MFRSSQLDEDENVKARLPRIALPTPIGWEGNLSDNWIFFKQKFEIYLLASGNVTCDSSVKTALLLSAVGDRALKLYNTFVFDKDSDKGDYEKVINKFGEHFCPEKNITYERFLFFTRNQKEGETYENYVMELRDLSASCEFGSLTEDLIKDRLVCGISDVTLKDRLLRTRKLTLAVALEICCTSQRTKEQVEVIASSSLPVSKTHFYESPCRINKVSQRSSNSVRDCEKEKIQKNLEMMRPDTKRHLISTQSRASKQFICNRCGYSHMQYKCPAFGKTCLKCGKLNHFSTNCRSVNEVENDGDDINEVDSLFLGATVINSISNIRDWSITLEINNFPLQVKVDTGAQANILSDNALNNLNLEKNNLLPVRTKLTTYTGECIPCLGKCTLPCKYNGRLFNLNFYVVSGRYTNILGLKSAVDMQLAMPLREVHTTIDMFSEFKDIFEGLGCMKGEYSIKLKENSVPVIHACRKVPLAVLPRLKEKLNEMIKQKVIVRVTHPTEWVNSLVIVYKPNGDLRLCIDPKDLNQVIMRQHFSLPTFEEITSKLTGASVFSTLDVKNGFWNVKLSEASSDLCCFNTPFGRYKFLRMPFGLSSASEVFQQKMREILENLDGTEVFIDDILIWGKCQAEHDSRLRLVLERLRQENIKLNKDKCKFNLEKVKYLGHIISKEGLKLDDGKIKSIVAMKSPRDRKELERFLGVVNYVSKFIPNFSNISASLRNLLKKDVEFSWLDCHEKVFQNLKEKLAAEPVLQFFNENLPVTVSVDASRDGLGAVLLQNSLPVAYASKALNECQKRYAQIEKELLAILFGCERFNQFIFGRKVTIESDHAPLISIVKKPLNSCSARIQRMLLKLQKYNFELVYKRGKELYLADTLSRSYDISDSLEVDLDSEEIEAQIDCIVNNINASPLQLNNIKESTSRDEELLLVRKFIVEGWPSHKNLLPESVRKYWSVRNDLTLKSDIIFKGSSVVVPMNLRREMLQRLHFPHMGVTKTLLRSRDCLYWPGIHNDIYNIVSSCETCLLYSNSNKQETLIPHEVPKHAWQKIAADLFELNGKMYLLTVDYFSKFPELVLLTSTTSDTIINNLKRIFSRNGIPEVFISDGGPQFSSEKFALFCKQWNIEHKFSSPEYPQSNGMVERTIQSIKNLLRKASHEGKDMYLAMLEFRNTPISHDIPSPAQIFFNRKLRGILPLSSDSLQPRIYKNVKSNLEKRQCRSKIYFDCNKKDLRPLVAGERVLFKVGKQWRIGEVLFQLDRRTYKIVSTNGVHFVRNRIFIKPFSFVPFYIPDDIETPCAVNESPPVEVKSSPLVHRNSEGYIVTSSGRVSRPPDRFGYTVK